MAPLSKIAAALLLHTPLAAALTLNSAQWTLRSADGRYNCQNVSGKSSP